MKVLIWSAGPEPYSAAWPFYRAAKRAGLDVEIAGDRSAKGAQKILAESFPNRERVPDLGHRYRTHEVFGKSKYDWVFSFVSSNQYKEIYNLIRKGGVKLLLWYADMLDERRRKTWQQLIGHFDVAVCSSMATTNTLERMGAPAVFMPQYFELAESAPLPPRLNLAEPIHDVCFIGQLDEHRMGLISELKKHFDIRLCGARDSKSAVFGQDMAKVYAQSKIAVSISRGAYIAPTGLLNTSNRIYRVMGCGCFLLDDVKSCTNYLFEPGKHYETFDGSSADLLAKIRYWLAHDMEREKITVAGQQEVLAKHTLEIRIHEYWALMEQML